MFKYLIAGLFCIISIGSLLATNPSLSFVTPHHGKQYYSGDRIYVKVNATDPYGIEYVDLYLDNTHNLIAREYKSYYEWDSHYDNKLKNLHPGRKYKLIAVAKNKKGYKTTRYIEIYIEEKYDHCEPTYNPAIGFHYPQNNTYYDHGDPIYVKALASSNIKYIDLYLNDCHYFVRRENKADYEWKSEYDAKLKNLAPGTYKLILIGVDKYGEKHIVHRKFYVVKKQPNCHYEYKFLCLQDEYLEGHDIYVEVDFPSGREYVDYAKLYVNGHEYGREDHWPYQWGKGFKSSGSMTLNNVHAGNYKIRCDVYDKCGGKKSIEKEVYVTRKEYCYEPSYNFEQYNDGYPITNDQKWASIRNFHSPTVGGHGIYRKKTMKVKKGYGAALDLGLLRGGNYEICHYLYVPYGYESSIGFYDDDFNTVKGFTEFDLGPEKERWMCIKYKIDFNDKKIKVYVNGNYKGGYSFYSHNVRYMVFHGVNAKHKYYVDDIYLKYHCIR